MGILGGLIGGASRGVTANGGIGGAIARREESNRRDDRNEREEKAAKLKEKIIKTQMLATRIADPNQSDAAVIQATNELNEINGIPVKVTTIEEALPQRAEAKKIANLLSSAKGNFTPTLLKDVQLSLTQYESRFGENEALRGQLEAGRASLDKQQNTEIDFMARNIANSADGGKSSPQQLAEFTRLKGKLFAGGDKEISNRVNQRAMEFRKQNKDLQFTQSRIDKNLQRDDVSGLSDRNANIRVGQLTRKLNELNQKGSLTAEEKNEVANINSELKAMTDFKRLGPEERLRSSFADKAGKGLADKNLSFEEEIRNSEQSDRTIDRGLSLIEEGVFTGPLANVKTEFNKYLREFGINLTGTAVESTESFAMNMAQNAADILGSRILGSGTAVSDEDRRFALRLAAGDITLDGKSIKRILNINKLINKEKRARARAGIEGIQGKFERGSAFEDDTKGDRSGNGGMTAEEFLKKQGGR